MNRRGFMKALLGCSAVAALPVAGKAVSSEPVIAVDPAQACDDDIPEGYHRIDGYERYNGRDNPEGGFIYADEMSERLRDAMQPIVKFRKHRNLIQEEMNKIANARLDNAVMSGRQFGKTVVSARFRRANANAWNEDLYRYSAELSKALRSELHAIKV
ncbi:MAG: twin-arginine translocation signal domain-containing protein [Gammaproteobacteria bacterium]